MILKVMVKMKLQGIEIWYTYNNIMVKVDFGYNRVILDRVIALGLGKFQLFAVSVHFLRGCFQVKRAYVFYKRLLFLM